MSFKIKKVTWVLFIPKDMGTAEGRQSVCARGRGGFRVGRLTGDPAAQGGLNISSTPFLKI